MGFTTGFLGGATLVLGTTYLSLVAHQRTRSQQAATLRAQTYILNSLTYVPLSAPPPQSIADELALLEHQQELLAAAEQRHRKQQQGTAGFVEQAKARWNAEVEGAVRWVATRDWVAAREDAEDKLGRVWETVNSEESVESGRVLKDTVVVRAGEAKEAGVSMWEKGFRKTREVAEKAKAAVVGLAEDNKASQQQQQQGVKVVVGESEAERVIRERYERTPEQVLSKSVEEVLAERYKPLG